MNDEDIASKFGTTSVKESKPSEIIFEPKDYQTEAIKRGLQFPEVGFFLATGLGKTIIMLIIFWILKQKGISKKMLVIAKRRIIHNVWPKEVLKWGLPLKVVKVHGSEKRRLAALEEEADIYLMTYQGIDWLSTKTDQYHKEKVDGKSVFVRDSEGKKVLKQKAIPKHLRTQFDVLCLDESSMIKNWTATRSQRLRTMLPNFDRRYALTASPIPRSMMDIFSQLYCLDMGDTLGKFIGVFKNKYWIPGGFKGKKYELREGAEEEIYEAIRPLVLRFPKDVIDLPPLTRMERIVQLPEEARRHYRELEENFITHMREGTIVAANAGVATQKLRQMAGGAIYQSESEYDDTRAKDRRQNYTDLHDAKIENLRELIEELQGEPLLIAYEFDHERKRIQAAFNEPIPHIGGGTSDAEADELIDKWNAGALPVLLGHPDSIAHGLNLQESGWNICFFGIGWNLENHMQFIDRVYRQGQEHAVWVYLIIAEDTIDELVVDVLAEKDANQEHMFDALQTTIVRDKKMHEWKKRKLPGKLPATDVVVQAFIKHTPEDYLTKWSWWDDSKEEEWAVYGMANTIMVSIGGWLPNKCASFLTEVFGKKVSDSRPIGELKGQVQRTIFDCLKLDTVNAEAPLTRKGKLGHARIYISKDPAFTKGAWPLKSKEPTMADTAEKKSASKFGGKKAPAKKAAAKKAPAKKAATKKAPAKKAAAKKGGETGRSMDLKARVTRGKKEPSGGIHAGIFKLVNESKGTILGTLVDQCAKKLDHERAKDAGFVQGYIRGGVRRGYLNLAS